MQKCSSCGAELPENSRFCGKCGSVQDALATDAAATRSNTPQPQSWAPEGGTIPATWSPYSNYPAQDSAAAWSPNVQAPATPPPPPAAENEDERRRGIPPWSPLYGAALGGDALLGSGQAYTPGAPVVQGTPQIGSVPSVAGSPTPYTNAPVGHLAQGPANAAVSHPAQGPGNAAPVVIPCRGQGIRLSAILRLLAIPYRDQRTCRSVIPCRDHSRRTTRQNSRELRTITHLTGLTAIMTHPVQHEPHRHHTHRTEHEPHAVSRMTKVAGGSTVKTIIIVVTTVVVVAAGGIGAAAHFLSRPQPLISITSKYKVGNTLAGANGTILHISGQQFSSNSAITFLLDGHVAPGNAGTRSDANGNFSADVTITDAWSVGTHTLTARDASNNSTKNSVSVTIVQQGQANTPGPNGAPPDDASFKVIAQIQKQSTAGTRIARKKPRLSPGILIRWVVPFVSLKIMVSPSSSRVLPHPGISPIGQRVTLLMCW